METRGKNGLCAVSCSLKFIFWENLKLECRSRWNWAGMLTGAQRDSGPVQSRGDFRKLWWCNCVVAIENSLARMANFYFESHWAPLSAIKHLRICYVLEKLLPHRVRPGWWKYTVTSSLKALHVAGFFHSQGFLAGWTHNYCLGMRQKRPQASMASTTHHADAEASLIHSIEITEMTDDVFCLPWPAAQIRNVSQGWPSRYYLQSFKSSLCRPTHPVLL